MEDTLIHRRSRRRGEPVEGGAPAAGEGSNGGGGGGFQGEESSGERIAGGTEETLTPFGLKS
jgi:hypothetical protein